MTENIRLNPDGPGTATVETQVTRPVRNAENGLFYNEVRLISRYSDGSICVHNHTIYSDKDSQLLPKPDTPFEAFLQFGYVTQLAGKTIIDILGILNPGKSALEMATRFGSVGEIREQLNDIGETLTRPGIIPDNWRPDYSLIPGSEAPWNKLDATGKPRSDLGLVPNAFAALSDSSGDLASVATTDAAGRPLDIYRFAGGELGAHENYAPDGVHTDTLFRRDGTVDGVIQQDAQNHVTSVTDYHVGATFSAGEIGSALGAQIGKALAGDNVATQIGASALLSTLFGKVGAALQGAAGFDPI